MKTIAQTLFQLQLIQIENTVIHANNPGRRGDMAEKDTLASLLKQHNKLKKDFEDFVQAVAKDYSKVLFRIDEMEKQVAAIGIDGVVAAPPAVPTDPDELPGANDMEEFKPESFEGGPEKVTGKEPTPEVKKKAEGLFEDGIPLTDEQLAELEKEEPDEGFEDEEE